MINPNITIAQINRIDISSELNLKISLSHIKGIERYGYVLIIKSETSRYAKFTIYPLNEAKVLKLILTGLTQIDEHIEDFSRKLRKYKIIHSSGLVLIGEKIYFECYLDLSLDDEKYKDLKILLDKNKSKFKDIKLEELSLPKVK